MKNGKNYFRRIVSAILMINMVLGSMFCFAGCEYDFGNVEITEEYLDYHCYDTHLSPIEKTEKIGKADVVGSQLLDWEYRGIVGEPTEVLIHGSYGRGAAILQNPKYYVNIRKEWSIKELTIISTYTIYSKRDDENIATAKGEDLTGSGNALGVDILQGRVNVFGTTTEEAILDQMYNLINEDPTEQYLITKWSDWSSFARIYISFEESENIIWVSDIRTVEVKGHEEEVVFAIDIGGMDCEEFEKYGTYIDTSYYIALFPGSALYEWIAEVYASQAYADYCGAVERLANSHKISQMQS